jgi:excisionase family DNA binding protein
MSNPRPPTREAVLLTPEQAAHALGISRWKLYDLLRRGALSSIRMGSCRRVPTKSIDDFVARLLQDEGSPPDLGGAR